MEKLSADALDLINRQKAENDTLKNVIKNSFLEKAGCNIDPLAEIKAEAYKEFAKRLKEKMVKHNFKYADTLFSANVATAPMVNNLLKEMEGAASEIED